MRPSPVSRPNAPLKFQLTDKQGIPVYHKDFETAEILPVMVTVNPPWFTEKHLLNFKAFAEWRDGALIALAEQNDETPEDRYWLRSIVIETLPIFHESRSKPVPNASVEDLETGKRPGGVIDGSIGFAFAQNEVSNGHKEHNWLSGAVFLRGPSVAMMIFATTDTFWVIFHVDIEENGEIMTERWVPLTVQRRTGATINYFLELPAGMLDDSDNFAGTAARELEEEAGIIIPPEKLVNLTEIVTRDNRGSELGVKNAMYPSPGGCDEYIEIFLYQQKLSMDKLLEMQGKQTGIAEEKITLRLVRFEDLRWVGSRDSKATSATNFFEMVRERDPRRVARVVTEKYAQQYTAAQLEIRREQEEKKKAKEAKAAAEAETLEGARTEEDIKTEDNVKSEILEESKSAVDPKNAEETETAETKSAEETKSEEGQTKLKAVGEPESLEKSKNREDAKH